jgi:hypothetical protein
MVPVTIWGGPHDGARVLVTRDSIQWAGELRYLGQSYVVDRDEPNGWKAVYAGERRVAR